MATAQGLVRGGGAGSGSCKPTAPPPPPHTPRADPSNVVLLRVATAFALAKTIFCRMQCLRGSVICGCRLYGIAHLGKGALCKSTETNFLRHCYKEPQVPSALYIWTSDHPPPHEKSPQRGLLDQILRSLDGGYDWD